MLARGFTQPAQIPNASTLGHERLDLVGAALQRTGQYPVALLGDQHIVLDANPDATPTCLHAAVIRRYVQARFDIEPGLYFIDMLLDEVKQAGNATSVNWDRVDFFRPYGGVRIEDEVLCTDAEADNLTRPAFAAQA